MSTAFDRRQQAAGGKQPVSRVCCCCWQLCSCLTLSRSLLQRTRYAVAEVRGPNEKGHVCHPHEDDNRQHASPQEVPAWHCSRRSVGGAASNASNSQVCRHAAGDAHARAAHVQSRWTSMCTFVTQKKSGGTTELASCASVALTALWGDGSSGCTGVLCLIRSEPGGRAAGRPTRQALTCQPKAAHCVVCVSMHACGSHI